jgi:hypothetical protein
MVVRAFFTAHKFSVIIPALGLLIALTSFSAPARAQAVAEAAGATSVSATAASSARAVAMPKLPDAASAGAGSSAHLIASSGPPADETNRKALESSAGKDAAKVLLRATPVEAQIWVNGKIVGKTPLLLVLAPGKYEVEMRGARGQTAKRSVALLPRETRELAVPLSPLYPGHVTVTHP